jgi:hypothetical protein
VIESRLQVHPHRASAQTPSRLGREVTRCLTADIRRDGSGFRTGGEGSVGLGPQDWLGEGSGGADGIMIGPMAASFDIT